MTHDLDAASNAPPSALAHTIFKEQREAFARKGAPSLEERLDDLARLAKATKAKADALANAITADFGNRSKEETKIAEIWAVVTAIRHTSKHLAEWMKPKAVAVPRELRPARAQILSQPLGVVGIISAWNYPFQLAIIPLLEALAAGNRVMVKPSELTPRTSEFLATFLGDLFARDKVAVILGGPDIAADFASLPFNHLLFTGSTGIGRKVMQAAAENLTPVTLELGGKSPCIIGEDADLAKAAGSIAFGKLLNAGQTCIAPDYILTPQNKLEAFVAQLTKKVPKLYPRLQDNPDYTTIISEHHYRRLQRLIEEAKAQGARIIALNPTGEELTPQSRIIAPTLVIDPSDELALMREEIFGPVLPIKSYTTLDEAIQFINARPRPLALYYFGKDREGRDKVLQKTISGGVSINETMMHVAVNDLPFGGIGASGFGAYHGEIGFQTFSHHKSVFLQSGLNSAALLRPPFKGLKRRLIDLLTRL